MGIFLGLPYWIWLIICVAIATAYLFFVPAVSNKQGISSLERYILKYAHSLVWIILATASILANFGMLRSATFLALLSLPVYLAFIFTLLKVKVAEKKSLK